jgi:hypothetical protein
MIASIKKAAIVPTSTVRVPHTSGVTLTINPSLFQLVRVRISTHSNIELQKGGSQFGLRTDPFVAVEIT